MALLCQTGTAGKRLGGVPHCLLAIRSDPYVEPLFTNRDPFLDQAGPWKASQECGGEDSALRRQLNPDDLGERWVSLQRYHCY
jgi:hypothetical protein